MKSAVEHYTQPNLTSRLIQAIERSGLDPLHLTQDDIAPMSEFHVMGRVATERLAHLAQIKPTDEVLDLGCGIGGPARFLATAYSCHVTGVDLTPEYIDAAKELSRRTKQERLTEFITADATHLPFPDAAFDLAWSQHCNMNVEDKEAMFSEIRRTLKSGHSYVFHEIFSKNPELITYPVPWAAQPTISHLLPAEAAQDLLLQLGFEVEHWQDQTEESHAWFAKMLEKMDSGQGPPLSLNLLLPGFREMAGNLKEALRQGSATVVMARIRKRGEPNA